MDSVGLIEIAGGELLVSAALIKKRDHAEKFNRPEDISPTMKQVSRYLGAKVSP